MSTETIDWTEKYDELHEMLRDRYRRLDRDCEEAARSTIEPLSDQIWSIIRGELTNENYEELSRQAYCVAVQAVLYHLDKLESP